MLHESDMPQLLCDYYVELCFEKTVKIIDVNLVDDSSIKFLYHDHLQNIYCSSPLIVQDLKFSDFSQTDKNRLYITSTAKSVVENLILFNDCVLEKSKKNFKVFYHTDSKKLQTQTIINLGDETENFIAIKMLNSFVLASSNSIIQATCLKVRPEVFSHSASANLIFFSINTQLLYFYIPKKFFVANVFTKKLSAREFSLSNELESFVVSDKTKPFLVTLTKKHEVEIYTISEQLKIVTRISLSNILTSSSGKIFTSGSYIFIKDQEHSYYAIDYNGNLKFIKKNLAESTSYFDEVAKNRFFNIQIDEKSSEKHLILWSLCENF